MEEEDEHMPLRASRIGPRIRRNATMTRLGVPATQSRKYAGSMLDGIRDTLDVLDNMLPNMSTRILPDMSTRQLATGVEEELLVYCQQETQELEGRQAGVQHRPGSLNSARHRLFTPQTPLMEDEMEDADSSKAATFRHQLEGLVDKYKPDVATITLKYRDLTVDTDALVGAAAIPTVGDSFKNLLWGLIGERPPTSRQRILHNISGVVEPARLTLLLGPPGSGKSVFLKVLAGRYTHNNNLDVSGVVTFNGHTFDDFCVNRTAAFINQVDAHLSQLTVLDILSFAYDCQNGDRTNGFNLFMELRNAIARHMETTAATKLPSGDAHSAGGVSDLEEQILAMGEELYHTDVKVTNMMRAFGILNAQHTSSRDCSGGERKRLTLAEMMLGPRRIMFMDEISTGLDSATLFSIMTSLRDYVHTFKVTCVVSLLQPPPEVYNLFDDLCLMSQGQVVYHGPVPGAIDFFTSLGFVCPPRKDVPSFLQEVTAPSGQHEFAGAELMQRRGLLPGLSDNQTFVVPVEEMVQHFWDSKAGVTMKAKLDSPLDASQDHPAALATTKYAMTPVKAFKVALRMALKLSAHNIPVHVVRLVRTVLLALLVGSLFFKTETSVLRARALVGAFFMSVNVMSMGSILQMPATMYTKDVWFKWRDSHFYSAWAHVPAAALAQIPITLLDSFLWTSITYFMWGLYPALEHFLLHWLILASFSLCLNSLFRAVGFVFPTPFSAVSYGGVVWSVFLIMSGFAIVRDQIPTWWLWVYYTSPFAWSMRALCINEFTSTGWQAASPATPGNTLGDDALALFGLFTDKAWVWGGVTFLLGTALLLDMISILGAQYLTPSVVSHVKDEEALAKARQQTAEMQVARRQAAHASNHPFGKDMATEKLQLIAEEERSSSPGMVPPSSVSLHVMPDQNSFGLLSFVPITLVFRGLRYSVPNPAFKKGSVSDQGTAVPERLELLKGITGFAEPGVLTALMGGSGAGKTTLMNCIAGRTTIGVLDGQLTVNGHPKDQRTWSRVVGYCEQADVHTAAQTVKEALCFSATLRLPQSNLLTPTQVGAIVEDVMEMLELTSIQFSLVGQVGNGLSVEQRKRLTIGVELVANPSVIMMDEPTSGLDARAAAIVIQAVKRISRSGRTIMVTIHQPSIEIFEAYDQLLLLQHGGRTSYFGPLGAQSQHLVEYLQRVPGCPPLAAGHNPATYMLEVTGGAVAVVSKTVEIDWPEYYLHTQLAKTNEVKAAALVRRDSTTAPLVVEGGLYAVPLKQQVKILARKHFSAYWRNPAYNFTRLLTTVMQALLFGTIWYKAGTLPEPAEPKHVQTMMGIISTCATALGNVCMLTIIPVLGGERAVYYRERAASMYSPWAYSLTVTTVESPWLLAQALLFIGILYPLVGFQPSGVRFLWYLLLSWQSLSYYASLGMMLCYLLPSPVLASLIGSSMNVIFAAFDGFVLPAPSMPAALRWINRVIPTGWVLQGLAGDQLLINDGAISFPFNPSVHTVRQFVETIYGYNYGLHWFAPFILFVFIAVARVGAVLGLRYLSFLRR